MASRRPHKSGAQTLALQPPSVTEISLQTPRTPSHAPGEGLSEHCGSSSHPHLLWTSRVPKACVSPGSQRSRERIWRSECYPAPTGCFKDNLSKAALKFQAPQGCRGWGWGGGTAAKGLEENSRNAAASHEDPSQGLAGRPWGGSNFTQHLGSAALALAPPASHMALAGSVLSVTCQSSGLVLSLSPSITTPRQLHPSIPAASPSSPLPTPGMTLPPKAISTQGPEWA